MTISSTGLQLIKHFESFFDTAYQCAAGKWTIGWGTTVYPTGKEVQKGDMCTRDEAETFLAFDMATSAQVVTEATKTIQLSQLEFDALVSFSYNIGDNAFQRSTLLKRLLVSPRDPTIIGNENMKYQFWGRDGLFLEWSRVDGVRNKGLIRRRKAEAWLFATGHLRFFEEMNSDLTTPLEDYVRSSRRI